MIRFCKNYLIYFAPVIFLVYLILESYQIDFRVFYIAGKSVLYNLDPYVNHVSNRPELYIPVNSHDQPTSGFLYPPLAALLFAPLGLFSYPVAKMIFSLFIIFNLIFICFYFVKQSEFKIQGEAILFLMSSFPILATFERGQIDIFVLCLTVLSFYFYKIKKLILPASLLLALASCIKIFPLVTLIYYFFNKKFKFILYFVICTFLLFIIPLIYFDISIYQHFFQVILPNLFGQITSSENISTHGQNVINNIVISRDSTGLFASRDLSNGYMNPLLKNNTFGAVILGLFSIMLLLISSSNQGKDYQFYCILNTINLFNPKAWIMGLVWYIPMFLFIYPQVSKLGKILILLPIFIPPFTNVNAILAYVISLLFSLGFNNPNLSKYLLDKNYNLNRDLNRAC